MNVTIKRLVATTNHQPDMIVEEKKKGEGIGSQDIDFSVRIKENPDFSISQQMA